MKYRASSASLALAFVLVVLSVVVASTTLASTSATPTATPRHLPPQHVTAPFPVPTNTPLGFRVNMLEQNGNGLPFTGALVFRVNSQGIINGIYESDSIRPDPIYGRPIDVTGGITEGNHIRLQIGVGSASLTVRGTITTHAITASAARGRAILEFNAERVHLHNPPEQT